MAYWLDFLTEPVVAVISNFFALVYCTSNPEYCFWMVQTGFVLVAIVVCVGLVIGYRLLKTHEVIAVVVFPPTLTLTRAKEGFIRGPYKKK